jgi:hypothetical protein
MSSIQIIGGFVSIIPNTLIEEEEKDTKTRGKKSEEKSLSFSQIMQMMNQPSEVLFGGQHKSNTKSL